VGIAVLALLFFLVGDYERDWWVLREPPESYRPSYKADFDGKNKLLWKQGK
jgi:hypothetical protein